MFREWLPKLPYSNTTQWPGKPISESLIHVVVFSGGVGPGEANANQRRLKRLGHRANFWMEAPSTSGVEGTSTVYGAAFGRLLVANSGHCLG